MGSHNELGKKGEALAADYLVKKGYNIVYRNYRYLKAEIDILARKKEFLVVIEVKSRSSGFYVPLEDTITKKKIKLLVMAADHYVTERNLDVEVRFDIITVIQNKDSFEIEHLQDAFYHF